MNLVPDPDPKWSPRRVAILGASGLTGSGLASQLSQSEWCDEVVLFDLRRNILESHAIDLLESQIVTGRTRTKLTVADLDRAASVGQVDLVVVAASLPENPDGDRTAFLAGNLDVLAALVAPIEALAGTDGIVMILTNPADVLASVLAATSSIPPQRIFGYCLNDSVRFAAAVARELGVDPSRVEACVLGEHGDGQVPLYSLLRLDGASLELDPAQRARVDADARGWFRRWSDLRPGRSSGWTTPVGALATIERLVQGEPVPAAVWGPDAGLAASHVTLLARFSEGHVVPAGTPGDDQERALVAQAADALAHRVAAVC
ncbi:MAG TPA: hypothetical protein VJU58_12195 [Microbacterium sp.]|nr:hypothetical protein [Microbacterium sp.]